MMEHDDIERTRNVFGYYHAMYHRSQNQTRWSRLYNEIEQAQTKKTKKITEGKKKTKKKTKKKIVTADTSPPTVHTDPRRTPKDAEGIG